MTKEKIAYILATEGPDGHPIRKEAKDKAKRRWRKLADVLKGAAFFKVEKYQNVKTWIPLVLFIVYSVCLLLLALCRWIGRTWCPFEGHRVLL